MDTEHAVQVIAIASGKGGVGKTTVAVNLSLALAELGRRVVLLDSNLEFPNVDVQLGLVPRYTLVDLIEGRCELSDTLMDGPGGVRVVASGSGVPSMVRLSRAQHSGLIQAFSEIADSLDVLVIDTATGIGEPVVSFICAAHEVLVIVCDEPASISGAYALIKVLNHEHGMKRFRVLANMEINPLEGHNLFAKLNKLTDHFLDVFLEYAGAIPYDEYVRHAAQTRRAVYERHPRSKCSKAFQEVALKADAWPLLGGPRGHVEFFVERLVSNSKR